VLDNLECYAHDISAYFHRHNNLLRQYEQPFSMLKDKRLLQKHETSIPYPRHQYQFLDKSKQERSTKRKHRKDVIHLHKIDNDHTKLRRIQ
jgi:hypothetical protein